MKKLLALVLAMVMTLGLATVSASAAYPDADDVTLTEAVDVMSAVGVFKGDDNGNFLPKANLTREAAAKLIAYLDLGETTAEALPAVKVFDDVAADRWSAKYIAYCADAGYIAGDGTGKFFPTGALDGYAFGKMLLCVLGYDASIEGFTGDNWTIAVAKLMKSNNVSSGIDSAASKTLTREQAAQYCLNTIQEKTVTYASKGTNVTINGAVIATGASAASKQTGGVDNDTLIEKLYDNKLLKVTDVDEFGRVATKWYYKANGSASKPVTTADTLVTTAADEAADKTIVLTKDYSNTGTYASLAAVINDALDSEYTMDESTTSTVSVYANGKLVFKPAATGSTAGWVKATADASSNTYAANVVAADGLPAGTVIEFWTADDDNDAIERASIYRYTIAKVTAVDKIDADEELAETYGATVTYTFKDIAETSTFDDLTYVDTLSKAYTGHQAVGTFAKGDVLALIFNADGKILSSTPATVVTGVKTAAGTGYIRVDGTKYTLGTGVAVADNYKDTWTYYLDPNDIILAGEEESVEEDTTGYSYAYVLASEGKAADGLTGSDSAYVKLIDTDGKTQTVAYALKTATKSMTVKTNTSSDANIKSGDPYFVFAGKNYKFDKTVFEAVVAANNWYAYTVEDGKITVKALPDTVAQEASSAFVKDKQLVKSGHYATKSSVVTVLNKDGVAKTYTGYANFPAGGDATGNLSSVQALLFYTASNGKYVEKAYVYNASYAAPSTSADEAVMFVSLGEANADGKIVNVYQKGASATLTIASSDTTLGSAVAGELFTVETDADGISTFTKLTSSDSSVVYLTAIDAAEDEFIAKGSDIYKIDSDTQVYQVAKNNKSLSSGKLATASSCKVVLIVDSDKVISEAFIFNANATVPTSLSGT